MTIASDASLHVHLSGLLKNATIASATSLNFFDRPQPESKAEQQCVKIRQRIISYLDNGDLNRAIHASPLLFQAFTRKRKQLLLSTLFNTLGTAILEAFAVYRTSGIEFQGSRSKEKVSLFWQALEQHRQRPALLFELCRFFTEDDLVRMAAYHNRVVHPFTKSLASSFADGSGITALASDEKMGQLQLAFYRNRLDMNLLGKPHSYAPQNEVGDHLLRQIQAVV